MAADDDDETASAKEMDGETGKDQCVDEADQHEHVIEGKASILFPKGQVFYNPVQIFNRDLSVAFIRTWALSVENQRKVRPASSKLAQDNDTTSQHSGQEDGKISPSRQASPTGSSPIKILEALSATGLRAIRYAKEIPGAHIVANDISKDAVRAIKLNVKHNKVEDAVKITQADALDVIYASRAGQRFAIIDLDPYGTASPFIDAAVQSVANNGLICITCTDLRILAGGQYPEKCFASYGGLAIKNSPFCHEVALRLVLNAVATSAARYGRTIEPLASLSVDFYVRIFVKIRHSPAQVKFLASSSMITYCCNGCSTFYNQPFARSLCTGPEPKHVVAQGPIVGPLCKFCGSKLHVAGPMWAGPLHSKSYLPRVIEMVKSLSEETYSTKNRMLGVLTAALEEIDDPFFYDPPSLSKVIHSNCPSLQHIFSALLNAGWKACCSHTSPGSVKTNAPSHVIWDLMRGWVKLHPVNAKRLVEGSMAKRILDTEPTFVPDFSLHPNANDVERNKIVRYPVNPLPHWGPGTKAAKRKLDCIT